MDYPKCILSYKKKEAIRHNTGFTLELVSVPTNPVIMSDITKPSYIGIPVPVEIFRTVYTSLDYLTKQQRREIEHLFDLK